MTINIRQPRDVKKHVVRLPGIELLGWSAIEALETHLRFRSFSEDWDAPEMEAYDDDFQSMLVS